jgi:hypothetical protein
MTYRDVIPLLYRMPHDVLRRHNHLAGLQSLLPSAVSASLGYEGVGLNWVAIIFSGGF